jgi:anti-anti-sigma factor
MTVGLIVENDLVNGKRVVRLEGRLDASSAPSLEMKMTEIIDKKNSNIAMDFTKVTYLSSAGMRLLLSLTKKLHSMGGAFVIFSMHEDVMEIIRMAGFERILNLFNTESEAISAL